jgi:nucleoside-diphosphate-sugar epimerase
LRFPRRRGSVLDGGEAIAKAGGGVRVLIAGATGAIGRPLIRCLNDHHRTVFALARSPESARLVSELGAEPVIADALDAPSVKAAMAAVRPNAVINELTALPAHYTAAEMQAAAERDRKVRIEGNRNLLASLYEAGVRRYLLQSSAFWYAPGDGLADESAPFAFDASPAVAAGTRRYAEMEAAASGTPGIEFVALRYGFFYGPGTWFSSDGDMGKQTRGQQVPIIGDGQGVWSWVHIEDAAAATAAALECAPGAYNIVDVNPTPQRVWLPAFARGAGGPAPPRITEEEALATFGRDAVYYATRLRGASNEKAKHELNFQPRPLEWLDRTPTKP